MILSENGMNPFLILITRCTYRRCTYRRCTYRRCTYRRSTYRRCTYRRCGTNTGFTKGKTNEKDN